MLKKVVILFIALPAVAGVAGSSYAGICVERSQEDCAYQQVVHSGHDADAQTQKVDTSAEEKKGEAVGNEICPVSGEKIDENTKVTYEYKGKIYAFCCPVCLEEFKKDPEKYIEKMEKGISGGGTQEQSPHKEPHSH